MSATSSSGPKMKINLRVWRQKSKGELGRLENHTLNDVSPDMSFLEMLDVLNNRLVAQGQEAIAFDHDCREGICGSCSLVIDGKAHGPNLETTTCQLHMRSYHDGASITVEPFRANAFPVVKDLVVDRSAFDRIIAAGGYISVNTGSAPEANSTLVKKQDADLAMDHAACIGCGACVAACPNASAMLFVSAKISHLSLLPQGAPEREARVLAMVDAMDREGFGNCTNHYECGAACPKGIPVESIARMNRQFLSSSQKSRPASSKQEDGA
jgi:succinate dehydrogenase / fumarate reductase iron-sulfur subunit